MGGVTRSISEFKECESRMRLLGFNEDYIKSLTSYKVMRANHVYDYFIHKRRGVGLNGRPIENLKEIIVRVIIEVCFKNCKNYSGEYSDPISVICTFFLKLENGRT